LIVLAIILTGVCARLFLAKGGPQEVSAANAAVAVVPPPVDAAVLAPGTAPTATRMRLDEPPVRKLSRDPFMLGSDHLVGASNADGSVGDDDLSLDPIQRAQAAADELVLESTICGSLPLASISGRVVRQGEKIDDFVLERVEPTRVVLRRHDIRVILALR